MHRFRLVPGSHTKACAATAAAICRSSPDEAPVCETHSNLASCPHALPHVCLLTALPSVLPPAIARAAILICSSAPDICTCVSCPLTHHHTPQSQLDLTSHVCVSAVAAAYACRCLSSAVAAVAAVVCGRRIAGPTIVHCIRDTTTPQNYERMKGRKQQCAKISAARRAKGKIIEQIAPHTWKKTGPKIVVRPGLQNRIAH